MRQLRAAQFTREQQAEKAGVSHVGGEAGRHLPLSVDFIGGVGNALYERRRSGKVVVNVGGNGNGGSGHLVSQYGLSGDNGTRAAMWCQSAGSQCRCSSLDFLNHDFTAFPGVHRNHTAFQEFHAQERLVDGPKNLDFMEMAVP